MSTCDFFVGAVELWVSDASSGSPRQTVPIIVTSLMPPRLIRNVPLMVDQDSIAVISADKNFDIQDDDSWAAVTVRVVEGMIMCSFSCSPVVGVRNERWSLILSCRC